MKKFAAFKPKRNPLSKVLPMCRISPEMHSAISFLAKESDCQISELLRQMLQFALDNIEEGK